MVSETLVVPEAIYPYARRITGQSNFHLASLPAAKNTVQSRIKEAEALITGLENKYKMTFPELEEVCRDERIENPYSYEVEKDDWDWETAIEDHKSLDEIYRWIISVEENLSK
ncbi:MAG: hypothetical protein HND47_18430 [Chloroflexi bacterium]|nr:hypothetical protein [Chloroflexota bacterium]